MNSLETFAIRLFIAIGLIYLTQITLSGLGVREPANKAIFIVVLVVGIIFAIFGGTLFPALR